jgi:hypothetical protein
VSATTSHTAIAGIVVPIAVAVAVAVGVDPLIPGLVATAAAGYGLMLPVSTPPNAIVYGSGMMSLTPCGAAGSCSTSSASWCCDRCAALRATDF